jgi:hypothetical protein
MRLDMGPAGWLRPGSNGMDWICSRRTMVMRHLVLQRNPKHRTVYWVVRGLETSAMKQGKWKFE